MNDAASQTVVKAEPPEWTDERAREFVRFTVDRARAEWQRWLDAVSTDILLPVRAAIKTAIEAHDNLVKATFESDGAAGLWESAVTYRESVVADVLVPIRDVLKRFCPGDCIGQRALQICTTLQVVVDETPATCILPCSDALFVSREADSFAVILKKAYSRAQRRLGRKQEVRTVQLQSLAAYHIDVRLASVLQITHERIQEHVAIATGRLETALNDWTYAVLDAEHGLCRAAFVQPPLPESFLGVVDATPTAAPDLGDVARLVDCADMLRGALSAAAEALERPGMRAGELIPSASEAFEEDVARAGTLLLSMTDRGPAPKAQALETRRKQWAAWHMEVVDRLDFCKELLSLRKTVLRTHRDMMQYVLSETLKPLWRSFGNVAARLHEAERDAYEAFESMEAKDAPVCALQEIRERMLGTLRESFGALPELLAADAALAHPGKAARATLAAVVELLPERLSFHNLVRSGKIVHAEPRVRDMRHEIRKVVVVSDEHLARRAVPLGTALSQIWGASNQVIHIVEFNLDAALDEFQSRGEPQNARELATSGLRNAAQKVLDLARSALGPWHDLESGFFKEFQVEWERIHHISRSESEFEGRWTSLWYRIGSRAKLFDRTVLGRLNLFQERGWLLVRRGRQQAKLLLEQGRSAILPIEVGDRDRLSAIDAISSVAIGKLREELPLVYGRLFAFKPLLEPYLLEGRTGDIERIRYHHERWKHGSAAGALVLPMTPGSGRTSLLNAVRSEFERTADVCMVTIDKRVTDISDFATLMARTFGIDTGDDPSLDRLEFELRNASPKMCLVDNMEHLLLRTPGGSDLMKRVLIFLSRTDSTICWIATIASLAWHFLETVLQAATTLVTCYYPSVLERSTLEDIVLGRHRRSGLPLEFCRPRTLSPLAKRRLNRAKSPEAAQNVLRKVYFERLHHASGENVMLALFYWLQSARFNEAKDMLTIEPVRPLRFKFFESFDLARAFTLKDLLLHHSLTLQEHSCVFRMTTEESIYQLEGLLNMQLIIPDGDGAGSTRIVPGVPYRLHPLIVHPTYKLLADRHIIH